ncbi:MAG TPA: hypothetical protein VK793_02005 [Steroidobacteraceae bacterium]|jgi:hypothetical protein|nr:hypothetical protein [Steroidobacteraceae bacterium]
MVALVSRNRDGIGVAALLGHCQDPITCSQRRNATPARTDNAGRPLARDKRPLRQELIRAADDQQVDIIDRRSVNFDQDLARTGDRYRDFGGAQLLRPTEFVDNDRAHC